jgi:hypothetical protein
MPSQDRFNEQAEDQKTAPSSDADLLKEIREDYRYFLDYWREIREEAATDLRYVAGDPWDPEERSEREENDRPCISLDEIGQYINQANNNLRQNKRDIVIRPKGSGATDDDAELRASIVRGIGAQSTAQAARTTSFEGAINCGMGFRRILTTYSDDSSFDQVPRIKRIPNSQTVLLDPDAKEADFSDGEKAFVTDTIRISDFARKYTKAQKKSFSDDDKNTATDWFRSGHLVIAEAWRVEKKQRRKLQLNLDGKIATLFEDELPKGVKIVPQQIVNERMVDQRSVVQYITNGVEILEKNEWVGSWIPIIGTFGKELYLSQGGNTKRVFLSLVRLARSPQMLHAYLCSQQIEEAGMAPRAPILLWEGQELADEEAWKFLNKIPRAYIKLRPVVDPVTGASQYIVPERHPFVPNFEGYELAKESARRSIQAAMGIMPQPTATQRRNEKSGVALQRIEQTEQVGSFHFTDNYNQSLEYEGKQLNELITKLMVSKRQIGVRNPDDTHSLLHVMTENEFAQLQTAGQIPQEGDYLISDRGEFDVTISTGPSFQSEREEASAFVDLIMQHINELPIAPQAKAALLARAVKMKNLGHIGDEIAKILDPQDDGEPIPPQAQALIQKLQHELQALNADSQQKEQQIVELQFEKKAKTVEMAARGDIEKMKEENKLAIAEVTTKAQSIDERLTLVHDLITKMMNHAHDRGMQARTTRP